MWHVARREKKSIETKMTVICNFKSAIINVSSEITFHEMILIAHIAE